jgi:hypothetical protein
MLRVELHRSLDEGASSIPVSGKGKDRPHVGVASGIQSIEFDRAFRFMHTRGDLLAKEQRRRQRLVREVIARGEVHGSSGGTDGALQGVGKRVEAVPMFVAYTIDSTAQQSALRGAISMARSRPVRASR